MATGRERRCVYHSPMWTLAPGTPAAEATAAALHLAAVLGFLLLGEVGLWLRRAEHQAWWAGSGRDLVNVAGLVAIAATLRLLGCSWPAALLVGGTETLLLFGATVFLATQTATRHPRAWSLVAGLLVAGPLLTLRHEVVQGFGRTVQALFAP
jgi:hypothetical protein